MSRQEDRRERSRQRAEAHSRRRRTYAVLFAATVVLGVLVPLAWNTGVEFGWVQPIQTVALKDSLRTVRSILFVAGALLYMKVFPRGVFTDLGWSKKPARKPESSAAVD